MYKERHSRVEEMHSRAGARSFPREGWGGGQRCSLVCRTRTLSVFHRRETPLAWAAFINTLAICCGQRFRLTTTTHRRCPETEGKVGRRCEEHSHWLQTICRWLYCHSVCVFPRFRAPNLAFARFRSLPSPTSLSSPLVFLAPKKKEVFFINQMFDLMKGFNYWLPRTGGVRLPFPLFHFPRNLSLPWQRGCVRARVCENILWSSM